MKSTFLKASHLKLAIAGLLLANAWGCSSVISKRPVGEKPARIVAKEWEGDWVGTDGAVNVKVVDADKAILRIAWVEDDEQGKPAMKTADVELRESGEWLFVNTREEDKDRGFVWGRIKNEDRQIIVWPPDDKSFAQCVKDGVFPGTLDGDEVILDELKPQHLKIITSAERGVLFAWDKPNVFAKVGN
jgi:hypothetical protein